MEYLAKSKDYVQERPGTWTHRVLFESGDIYKKIDEQKNLLSGALLREDTEKSFEFFSLLRYSDIFVFLKISLYGVATVFSVHAKA